jgi:hypothetical protein
MRSRSATAGCFVAIAWLLLTATGASAQSADDNDLDGLFDVIVQQRAFPVYDEPAADPQALVFYQGQTIQIISRIGNQSGGDDYRIVSPETDALFARWRVAPAGAPPAPAALTPLGTVTMTGPEERVTTARGVLTLIPAYGALDATLTLDTGALPEGAYDLEIAPDEDWRLANRIENGQTRVRFEIRRPSTPARRLESARFEAEWALSFEVRGLAEDAIADMLAIHPDSHHAYRLLARIAELDGDRDEADRLWERAEQLEPFDRMLWERQAPAAPPAR